MKGPQAHLQLRDAVQARPFREQRAGAAAQGVRGGLEAPQLQLLRQLAPRRLALLLDAPRVRQQPLLDLLRRLKAGGNLLLKARLLHLQQRRQPRLARIQL